MSETHSNVTDPSKIGVMAVHELNAMSIPPFPPYYQVWFSHLEQHNADLSSEIEKELHAGKPINEIFLDNIHGKYFTISDPSKNVEQFAAQALHHTNMLQRLAETFNSSAKEFRQDLADASDQANAELISDSDAKKLFTSLLDAAQNAIARNAELEASLTDASTKIASLQNAIETIAIDANTDFLTKLNNRRYFDSAMLELIETSRATGHPLCLIVSDIDHFKKFNDTWGHQVGDQVLKLVSSVLRENVKGQDLIARYGGEEFAIALPNTTLEDAVTLAENIRIAVSKRKLVNKSTNSDLGRITMSFGVAAFDEHPAVDALFHEADEALYAAKEAGRNCVMTPSGQC